MAKSKGKSGKDSKKAARGKSKAPSKTGKKTVAKKKKSRDVEKAYSRKQHIKKLERLVKSLQSGRPFRIQVAGERIYVPVDAVFNIEHEREGKDEELEFQLKWRND